MTILSPTLRTQNYLLNIIPHLQSPEKADKNAVFVNNNIVILQLVNYKTQNQFGYIRFHFSDTLSRIIIQFLNFRSTIINSMAGINNDDDDDDDDYNYYDDDDDD